MNKVAIAFSTKDRVELSRQAIAGLTGIQQKQPGATLVDLSFVDIRFDLLWVDGSASIEGQDLIKDYAPHFMKGTVCFIPNVRGGADAAIAHNLSRLLRDSANYDYIGLVENDVLLDEDWFTPTMALFEQGKKDGLHVGAVSARAYEDRILFQRDGYAVMHNLGAGMSIFTREAAALVLACCRTGHTLENRRTFMQVSGLDLARWNGFVRDPHPTCMDWQFERILAQNGLACLALTPAKCQMIGQDPPLEQQGLKLVTEPVEALRNDDHGEFHLFAQRMDMLRQDKAVILTTPFFHQDDGSEIVMPHQLGFLYGAIDDNWKLRWVQAHGPFVFAAAEPDAKLHFLASGALAVMASGGESGGSIRIEDSQSGYDFTIRLDPEASGQVLALSVPGVVTTREITVTARQPGVTFYGLSLRDQQLIDPTYQFRHSDLPSP